MTYQIKSFDNLPDNLNSDLVEAIDKLAKVACHLSYLISVAFLEDDPSNFTSYIPMPKTSYPCDNPMDDFRIIKKNNKVRNTIYVY